VTAHRVSRGLAVLLAGLMACTSTACFHIRAEAPPLPEHVRLLPADAPAEVSREYQTFYYAWGLFPMSPADQPAYVIEREHLVEARVVQGGLLEGILAGFLGVIVIGGFVLPQNITVEGNRTATLPPAPPATDSAPQVQ